MSILANLLKKTEINQAKAEIPPGVVQAVSSSTAGSGRGRYYLVGGLSVAAVAVGLVLGIYLNQRPVPPKPRETPQPAVAVQPVLSSARPEVAQPVEVAEKTTRVTQAVLVKRPQPRIASNAQAVKRSAPAAAPPQAAPEQKTVPRDRTVVDAYLFAARNAEAKRDYLTALKQYRLALDADPENYRIMNNIASTMLQLGMHSDALLVANRALSVKPDYVSAMVNAGIAHSGLGNGAAARGMFARAVSLDPSNRGALYNLALAQERAGTLDDALKSYRRLADGGDPQGYLGQGRLYELQGNRGEALKWYRELTALSDAGQRVKEQARERIKVLDQ